MKPAQTTASFRPLSYGRRTPEHEILETLALLAEGHRISAFARVKGHQEDTILQWLRQAAQHAEQLEGVLMAEFKVKRAQLDALWAHVRNKEGKKAIPRRMQAGSSGVRPCWISTAGCE